jgi:succinoglycan biosynthesis transport protein ExoP
VELREYLRIIRKWLWLIVVGTLLASGLAYAVHPRLPPIYRATTSLLIRTAVDGSDAHARMLVNRYLSATYRELLTKRPILEAAGRNLNLAPSTIAQLNSKVTVWVVADTSLIQLAVQDADPQLAKDLANEIVAAFVQIHGVSEGEPGADITVVEPASLPTAPLAPRVSLNTLVAAIGGCVLATGVAFLIEYLDDTLATGEDIDQTLSLPMLAAIPRSKRRQDRDRMPIGLADPSSAVTEAYRALYARLRFTNTDGRATHNRMPETMLITSPSSGEEKKDMAVNLGVAIAQSGLKVLLVDAHLRQPSLHNIFGLANSAGLTTLLAGKGDCRECICQTRVPNLYMLCSGPAPEPSTLNSQQLPQLVAEIKACADIVLFDGPPVLVSADAMVLAALVEGTLLAVERGATRRQTAVKAVQRLRGVRAKMLGAVLNKA